MTYLHSQIPSSKPERLDTAERDRLLAPLDGARRSVARRAFRLIGLGALIALASGAALLVIATLGGQLLVVATLARF
jgi:hypothetical protein